MLEHSKAYLISDVVFHRRRRYGHIVSSVVGKCSSLENHLLRKRELVEIDATI
jgi:hypothetical protein